MSDAVGGSSTPRCLATAVRDVTSGTGVVIIEPTNAYECTLGDHVFVGPFCEIQRGAVIGDHTRVQSHSFVCTNVSIGKRCFVGHGVMFTNDAFRNGTVSYGGSESTWEPTVIADDVIIGSNATILPVNICSHVVIGAGAVVTRNIDVPGTYVGVPARILVQCAQGGLRGGGGFPSAGASAVASAVATDPLLARVAAIVGLATAAAAVLAAVSFATGRPGATHQHH